MPAYVCWINKECLQLQNVSIPIKRYQRKATPPPLFTLFIVIFSYEIEEPSGMVLRLSWGGGAVR